jgi:hypothetical protein
LESIYGVKGSDKRISVWTKVPTEHQNYRHPSKLTFYAYARCGRKIFFHGGKDFVSATPSLEGDVVSVLDLDSMAWSRLTIGRGPDHVGPRAGHTMFVHKNFLYLWGGTALYGMSDNKLYRVDASSAMNKLKDPNNQELYWTVCKTKKTPPPVREEHSGVLYKGCYYVFGGYRTGHTRETHGPMGDLWCLNLANLKWSMMSQKGPMVRQNHKMFAARNQLYVFGGQTTDPKIDNFMMASRTLDDFDCYDIETKQWTKVHATGLDKPYDVSEFTLLPLYETHNNEGGGGDDSDDDPTSVLVFGGYTDTDKRNGFPDAYEMQRRYGTEWQDYQTPYRDRLLRYNISQKTWTLLHPIKRVNRIAQAYAAQLPSSESGNVKVLIGGGYGINVGAKSVGDDEINPLLRSMLASQCQEPGVSPSLMKPSPSDSTYLVSIAAAATNSGNVATTPPRDGWAWKFFRDKHKAPKFLFIKEATSPTLHSVVDLTYEDFLAPPVDSVTANNESSMLGVRVKLQGLKSQGINGQVGRCGFWLPEKERYQVYLHPHSKDGPKAFSVKPSNLKIATPYFETDLDEILTMSSNKQSFFPDVLVAFVTPGTSSTGKQALLEVFLQNRSIESDAINTVMDSYHGPVARKLQSVLQCVGQRIPGSKNSLGLFLLPPNLKGQSQSAADISLVKNLENYRNFLIQQKEDDSRRVKHFEAVITSKTSKPEESLTDRLGPWLKLVVTLDGIAPDVRREIVVSPDISMQNLYQQVLCPSVGWKKNYHCYAFRRIPHEEMSHSDSIEMLQKECWIGPKKSTAIDSMHQPYYIGGAMANDQNISIGQLFLLDNTDEKEMKLQFVHDFGDWWSHAITISKFDKSVAAPSSSVAHLLGGQGGCPPEDSGGIKLYIQTMNRLMGLSPFEQGGTSNPGEERWWELLNKEVRSKNNCTNYFCSPLSFDVETARFNLGAAIRSKTQKAGKENSNMVKSDWQTGASSESVESDPSFAEKPKDRTKYCAVCGVTVALKLCGGCGLIAFCSREHQMENWPSHRQECKRASKSKPQKKKKK